MKLLLYILIYGCCCPLTIKAGLSPQVEYEPEYSDVMTSPVEITQISKDVQSIIGITNAHCTNCAIVAWSLKKIEGDQPPRLLEECILFFEMVGNQTNFWITACVSRTAGRATPGYDSWRPSSSAVGMKWVSFTADKPDVGALSEFTKHSNFGYNECVPFIQPVYAEVFFPYKKLVKIVSKGIDSNEKWKRYNTVDGFMR
ncbi:MAG: hypothetical protein P4N60_04635 [Verrucomicrobiae bacterium]|nr:hypothetical protein [Verrucomicrobiae bacterium]